VAPANVFYKNYFKVIGMLKIFLFIYFSLMLVACTNNEPNKNDIKSLLQAQYDKEAFGKRGQFSVKDIKNLDCKPLEKDFLCAFDEVTVISVDGYPLPSTTLRSEIVVFMQNDKWVYSRYIGKKSIE